MCLYITKRYVHDDGREEIENEYSYCEKSNQREPCPDLSRREKRYNFPPSSAYSSPGLVPHDGMSTVSSSMPTTPISVTSGARLINREPSRSPTGSSKTYRLTMAPPGKHKKDKNALRPEVVQPILPTYGGRRSLLPEGIRSNHRRGHSDTECDDQLLSPRRAEDRAIEIIDRDRAREQQRREDRERKRLADAAKQDQMERDRRLAAQLAEEEKERRLDEQELREQQRLRGREHLREERRRKQKEDDDRRRQEEEEAETARLLREIEKLKREESRLREDRKRQELEEQKQVERLQRQIQDARAQEERERRARESRERRVREARQAEHDRLAEERRKAELRARIEGEERRLRLLEAQIQEQDRRRDEELRRAELAYTEADKRVREREARISSYSGRVEGPRLGERRNIMPNQGPFVDPFLGTSPFDDPSYRRKRGEKVLAQARHNNDTWDEDEDEEDDDDNSSQVNVQLGRRNTISGKHKDREAQYRQNFRRYPDY